MSFAAAITPLQSDSGGLLGGLIALLVFSLLSLGVAIVVIAGLWKVFTKAGEPGWAAIVPIYNTYVLVKISGNEILWFVLLLIPVINIVAIIKISIDLAKAFGQGIGFAAGMVLLPFVFYPLLGFGDYQYLGPQNQQQGGYGGMTA